VSSNCDLGSLSGYAPDALTKCFLEQTNAPSFVLTAFAAVVLFVTWRDFLGKRRHEAIRARDAVRGWTSSRQRILLRLALSGGLLLATTYLVGRIAEMSFGGHPSVVDETLKYRFFTPQQQWALVTRSPHWTYATGWAVAGVAVAALLLLYAAATGTRSYASGVKAIAGLVSLAALAGGTLSVIAALGNLFFEEPPQSRSMPFFHGLWACALFLLLWSWIKFESATDDLTGALRSRSAAVAEGVGG
jgi:hypothetical protein